MEEQMIINKTKNAKLYPIYKMFSWDLLFYYAIAFVFLVQVKGLNTSEVMFADAMFPIFKILFQIPSNFIIDSIGKRKSLIFSNFMLSFFLFFLILSTNLATVVLANIILAFSFSIKSIAESNLLYDSVSIMPSKNLFSKLEGKGVANYYYFDGITSMFTGLLFIVNPYLPIIISLMFTIIAIAISSCFRDIYEISKEKKTIIYFKDYFKNFAQAFKFIFNSTRLKAIMLFVLFFDGLIFASYTLRESLLLELNVPAEYFAVIFSSLTLLSGIGASIQNKFHNLFRNKTLSIISILYSISFIIAGIFAITLNSSLVLIGILIILFAIQYIVQGIYDVLESRYIKSFASAKMRTKIQTAINIIISISQFIVAFCSSIVLSKTNITLGFLIIGSFFVTIIFYTLVYMKPRLGLTPREYSKNDIETL